MALSVKTVKQKLRSGKRYLFYRQPPYQQSNENTFRANFVTLYENSRTLIVNNSETEKWANTQVSIPLDWITKIETLEDITQSDTILPTDVLLIIDEYL